MTTTAPSDLIVKFDALTDQTTTVTLGATTSYSPTTLSPGETGISFNLQIVEKGQSDLAAGSVGSTVVGSNGDQINTVTSKELAYVIARYFSDKSILTEGDGGGNGRNIRSMKLIVNVDPTA
jgi:hypothetical protein